MMAVPKYLALVTLVLLLTSCAQQPDSERSGEAGYVFINAHVIPMTTPPDANGELTVLHDHSVMVIDDRIVAVGQNLDVPGHLQVIDAKGGYLIPGLAEMHGHVPPANSFQGIPQRYLDDTLYLYLAGGVTTVRGMLGHPHQLELKEDVRTGKRDGPTLYLAGPSFSGNSIESIDQAIKRVIDQAQEGWDLLKIHPGLSLEQYDALTVQARAQNIDFAGHVPSAVGLEHALASGQRTIDHLDGYLEYVDALNTPITESQLAQAVRVTLDYQGSVVPTQALWATLIGAGNEQELRAYPELDLVPQQVRDGWLAFLDNPETPYFNSTNASVQEENRQRLLKALYDAGVPILFGTDAPQLFSVPGISVRHELARMADAGIDNAGILASATRNVGEYFAGEDTFGQIAQGHRADLLLVADNPLKLLSTIENHGGVMARGKWYSRADIEDKLAEIRAAYSE